MSGRKASEVNGLLRNAEKTRSGGISALDMIFVQSQNAAKKTLAAINSAEEELNNINVEIPKIIEEEMPDVANSIKEELKALKKSYIKPNINIDSESDKRTEILNKYKEIDMEADDVRRKIQKIISKQGRSDPWYCDAEYAQAGQCVKKYQELSKRVNNLQSLLSSKIADFDKEYAKAKQKLSQKEDVLNRIKRLEKQALEMKVLREEATKARESVQKEFAGIDKAIAVKFLPAEYEQLLEDVKQFEKYSERDVVKSFSDKLAMINKFDQKLQILYAEFLEKQSLAKASIDSIQATLDNQIYSVPEDEFRTEKGEKLSVISFLKKYCKGKYVEEIEAEMKKASKAFSNEDFDGVDEIVKSARSIWNEANQLALKTHENMVKTIDISLTIRHTLIDMNYKVVAKRNPNNEDGFCIECSSGDEKILFDRVTMGDDGNPIIDIDHTESRSRNCGSSLYDIRKNLAAEGLIINDITKNGVSIGGSNKQAIKSVKDTNVVQQGNN